jgi:hypothetical protein
MKKHWALAAALAPCLLVTMHERAEAATVYCLASVQGAAAETKIAENAGPACSENVAGSGVIVADGRSQAFAGAANVSADLRTGELKLVADTQSAHIYAQAQARMTERITIYAPGATSDAPAEIRFLFDIEGDVEPGLLVDGVFQQWAGLAVFGASIRPSYGSDYSMGVQFYGGDGTVLTSASNGWTHSRGGSVLNTGGLYVSDYIGLPTTFELSFMQQFETVSFDLLLSAAVSDNANFGHTIGTRLLMPGGASFTSESGVFLTQVPEAVPEPTTWATMLIGFGVVGATMRSSRRRRKLELVGA